MGEKFRDGITWREIDIDKELDEVTAKKIKEALEKGVEFSWEGQDPVDNLLKYEELIKILVRCKGIHLKEIAKPIDEIDEDE